MSPSARLTLLMCAAETLGMTGFAAYPSFLPLLTGAWQLSGAEAGLIGGAFFFGYMVAVPFLSGVTDRIDARVVYMASCVLMAGGTLGFALLARGVWSGAFFQALCGAGLAGCYMPGLRVLTDRVSTDLSNRPIAFYTASFGIGTSLSLLLAGVLGNLMDWRIAIALMAVGPLLAAVIVFAGTGPHAPPGAADAHWLPRFGPVLESGGISGMAGNVRPAGGSRSPGGCPFTRNQRPCIGISRARLHEMPRYNRAILR